MKILLGSNIRASCEKFKAGNEVYLRLNTGAKIQVAADIKLQLVMFAFVANVNSCLIHHASPFFGSVLL